MSDRYPIPASEFVHAIEVKRSRFRATVAPAPTVEAARVFIQHIREADPAATHHCWAYVIGPPGSSDRVGMSDDGEPHGTAGRPMLQVLSHAAVGDVAAVVTRWYGGTKLGTGGLSRAYADAVRAALDQMPIVERIEWRRMTIEIEYAGADPLQRLLPAFEAEVLEETYGQRVLLTVRLPSERRDAFAAQITEMSNGTAVLTDVPK